QSDIIYQYNGSTYLSAWKFNPTSTWYGDLSLIEPDKGYWIRILDGHTDTLLTILGDVSEVSRSIAISVGWNMVGSSYPVEVLLSESNLGGSGFTGGFNAGMSDIVYEYSASGYQSAWYFPNTQSFYGDLSSFKPGMGYWINVKDGHSGFTWDYSRYVAKMAAGIKKKKKEEKNNQSSIP
ncbi:MAG: hypothetical protein GY808_11630, partial [Gammaproteobacteria bacterium]|nr:hypothetical protein [Gammaproteobacteria bacterium]